MRHDVEIVWLGRDIIIIIRPFGRVGHNKTFSNSLVMHNDHDHFESLCIIILYPRDIPIIIAVDNASV